MSEPKICRDWEVVVVRVRCGTPSTSSSLWRWHFKSLRPELLGDERARELLRREVRSARQIVSPNVCRVFDLVVEDGHEMVSMEFVDGTTLADFLRDRGALELSRAGEIAAQLLAGIEAIHAAGLIHRDLKTENVMLTASRRVVVMDCRFCKLQIPDCQGCRKCQACRGALPAIARRLPSSAALLARLAGKAAGVSSDGVWYIRVLPCRRLP